MSLTSRIHPYKHGFGPFAPEVYRLPYAYPYRSPDAEPLPRRTRSTRWSARSPPWWTRRPWPARSIEPIQGEGGFVVPPAEFLRGVKDLCAKHGILVIADEVQTGTGRPARSSPPSISASSPTSSVLAKALASGYPLSAVVAPAAIMDAPGPSAIGGTYVGNPVACAAANAVLQVIEHEGLMERSIQIGKTVTAHWDALASQVDEIGEVRGVGAMVGVEFVTDRETKGPNDAYLGAVIGGCMRRGLITVSCGVYHNVLRHLIPLVITGRRVG